MAAKSLAINQTPHVAEIGDDLKLEFEPEVMGAYQKLRDAQQQSGVDLDGLSGVDGTNLRRVTRPCIESGSWAVNDPGSWVREISRTSSGRRWSRCCRRARRWAGRLSGLGGG
ncbi:MULTISPECIES: hypothetical protein [Streptomyces]|uniref:hypothetical protein n=1 Tax=Streptomyces TaxID=1883 RepID=UPI0015CF2EC6|nr:hypothetical protein [Streptomyces sp. b84]